MFNHLKSAGAKFFMNNHPTISRIAEILELKLEQGKINIKAKLKGETELVDISLNYAIEGDSLSITQVKTNKEWLNALADIFEDKYSKIDLTGMNKLSIKLAKFLI
jgi:hypothetical protein